MKTALRFASPRFHAAPPGLNITLDALAPLRLWILTALLLLISASSATAQEVELKPTYSWGSGKVYDELWSADSAYLALNTWGGVFVFDGRDTKQLTTELAATAAFSADSRTLYLSSWDDIVQAYDPATGSLLASTQITDPVNVIRIIPNADGSRVLVWTGTGFPGPSYLFDASLRLLETIPRTENNAQFLDDGTLIWARYDSGGIIVTRGDGDPVQMQLAAQLTDNPYQMQFSQDGKSLYVLPTSDGTFVRYDTATGEALNSLPGVGFVVQAFGDFAFVSQGLSNKLIDVATGEVIADLNTGGTERTYVTSTCCLLNRPDRSSPLDFYDLSSGEHMQIDLDMSAYQLLGMRRIGSLLVVTGKDDKATALFRYDLDHQAALSPVIVDGTVDDNFLTDNYWYLLRNHTVASAQIEVIGISSGEVQRRYELDLPEGGLRNLLPRPDDTAFSALTRSGAFLFEIETSAQQQIGLPPLTSPPADLAVSPDGTKLVASGMGGGMDLIDIAKPAPVWMYPTRPGSSVAFSQDGRFVFVNSGDILNTFLTEDGSALAGAAFPSTIDDIAVSGSQVIAAAGGTIYTIDSTQISDGAQPQALTADCCTNFNHVTVSANGVIAASVRSGPSTIALWSRTGRFLREITPPTNTPINSLAFRPDGMRLAAATWDGVFIWNVADGILVSALTQQQANGVAYSPDGKTIATAERRGEFSSPVLRLWTLNETIYPSTFSRNTRQVSDGWGIEETEMPLVWTADGLAAGDPGGAVMLWDSPPTHFSPPGARVFAYCDRLQNEVNHIPANERFTLTWSWYAAEISQIFDHLENARYTIAIDGERLSMSDLHLSAILRDPANDEHWTIYEALVQDGLTAGVHTVTYKAEWTAPIFDGFEAYGPGTANPTDEGTCTLTVQ